MWACITLSCVEKQTITLFYISELDDEKKEKKRSNDFQPATLQEDHGPFVKQKHYGVF
jgi:hypothetical protein